MKKQLATLALAVLVGVLGFTVAGVAAAGNGKPPSPPGQGACEHGNSGQPCKDDPQPDKGKDCEEHGNQGGVNEDHCKDEDTTTTETTETSSTETTVTETTSSETTSSEATSSEPSSNETIPSEASSSESSKPTPTILAKPPVAAPPKDEDAVLDVTAEAPKPTRLPQEAPFTL
jgi:hypothetical protein